MNILELLSSNSYLTVNKALARIVGLEASVLFADLAGSQLYWNTQKEIEVSDWFFRTREQIEEQTTLSAKVQLRCVKALTDSGLIQTKLKGLPAVTHYLIGEQEVTNLINLLRQKVKSSSSQMSQLDTTKSSIIKNINNNNINSNNINIKEESDFPFFESKQKEESVEDVKYYFELNQIINLFTEKTGANYRIPQTKSALLRYGPYKLIKERFNDGATLEDCLNIIEFKAKEWAGTKIMTNLVPDTIFRKSNFDKYLIQIQIKINDTQKPLKDENGNYANTTEGTELFIENIRQKAHKYFAEKRAFEERYFGVSESD